MKTNAFLPFVKGQLLVTMFLFALGQIGRVNIFGSTAVIYLYEISLVGLIVLFISLYKTLPIKHLYTRSKSIFVFFGILAVTLFVSFLRYSPIENLLATLFFLRLLTYFVFFAYFLYFLKSEEKITQFLKWPLLVMGIIIVISSILQYFLYPDLRNLYYLGWDPHLYRVFGTFFEPVIAAAVYGLLLIFIFFQQSYFGKNLALYVILGVYSLLIFLTYARSAIIALFTVVELYLIKKNIVYGLIVALAIVGILFLLPKKSGEGVNLLRTSSITSRVTDLQQGWQIAVKNPILGIGYNHIRPEKGAAAEDHAGSGFHSSFLIVLVTSGVAGLLSFLYVLYELGRINRVAMHSIIFLSIMSLFDNVLLHPFVLFLFFLLIPLSNPFRSAR